MIDRRISIRALLASTAAVVLAPAALILAGAFLPGVAILSRFGALLDVGIAAVLLAVTLATALAALAIVLGGRRFTVVLLGACLVVGGASGIAIARYSAVAGDNYVTFDLFRTLAGEPAVEAADAAFTYPSGDPAIKLHAQLWRAEGGSRARWPAVVYVHGGGFVSGELGSRPSLFTALSSAGYPVLDIEYRLAPPARWADAPADILCGLVFLRTIAAMEGIDPARVVLMGDSAGGNLALMGAYGAGTDLLPHGCAGDPVIPAGVVAVAPAADLAGIWADGTLAGPDQDPLVAYTGGTPTTVPDHYAMASPAGLIRPGLPPTLLIAAENDHYVRLARITPLADALVAAGTDARLVVVPFAEHGFNGSPNGVGAQLELAIVRSFLAEFAD